MNPLERIRPFPILLALSALLVPTLRGQCDDRTPINHPNVLNAPWNKVCYLGLGGYRGSGHLVGPYMVLTAAHCVYDLGVGYKSASSITVSPAQYVSSGVTIRPWGSRTATRLRTNSRYAAASSSDAYNYDYGAAFISTPFSGLTVFMPLKFDFAPASVNLSGYPGRSPSGAVTQFQFWESDSVAALTTRNIWSDVRSVGGASGGPIWRVISGTRNQVAINRGHSTDCNSVGVRLIDANCDLIKTWLEWTPTSGLTATAVTGLPRLDDQKQLLTVDQLRLLRPTADLLPKLVRARRVLQHIDGAVYDWDEFEMPRQGGEPLLAIQLRSPLPKLLDVEEAQVLLSASRRVRPELPSSEAVTVPAELLVRQQPVVGPPAPVAPSAAELLAAATPVATLPDREAPEQQR